MFLGTPPQNMAWNITLIYQPILGSWRSPIDRWPPGKVPCLALLCWTIVAPTFHNSSSARGPEHRGGCGASHLKPLEFVTEKNGGSKESTCGTQSYFQSWRCSFHQVTQLIETSALESIAGYIPYNMGIPIMDHPPVISIDSWYKYKPFPVMGGLWHCYTHIITEP